MQEEEKVILPKWYDMHVHLRQDENMPLYIGAQLAMGCTGVVAMPNTLPPTGKVTEDDSLPYWSIEHYTDMIGKQGGDKLSCIVVPLYLTRDTSPSMIEKGAESGLLKVAKYYPPHGTTNADYGCSLKDYIENGVFKAMEETGIILSVHGEAHGLTGTDYFDQKNNAEKMFYEESLPDIVELFPKLKIVCEHLTTKTATEFVHQAPETVGATITPQHLLYTVGDMLQGLKYHLYCLPLVKFEEDREALRQAVISENNNKFFAGTDSAPHAVKTTECGCAGGCFTGGCAPQLYAQAFEDSGSAPDSESYRKFLCLNGPSFYGLPVSTERFTLVKKEQSVEKIGKIMPLPLGMGMDTLDWSIERE